jgi:hypothetical protein
MSGAGGNLSDSYGKSADATQSMWGNIGSGIGQGFMAYGMQSKPTADTNKVNKALSPFDVVKKYNEENP